MRFYWHSRFLLAWYTCAYAYWRVPHMLLFAWNTMRLLHQNWNTMHFFRCDKYFLIVLVNILHKRIYSNDISMFTIFNTMIWSTCVFNDDGNQQVAKSIYQWEHIRSGIYTKSFVPYNVCSLNYFLINSMSIDYIFIGEELFNSHFPYYSNTRCFYQLSYWRLMHFPTERMTNAFWSFWSIFEQANLKLFWCFNFQHLDACVYVRWTIECKSTGC